MTAPSWPTPTSVGMVRRREGDEEEVAFFYRLALSKRVVERWKFADGGWVEAASIHSARPLVTLDPKSLHGHAVEVARRIGDLLDQPEGDTRMSARVVWDYLRSLVPVVTPPRPAEPTGLGVRVVDRGDDEWVRRRDGMWVCLSLPSFFLRRTWDELLDSHGPVTIEGGE